MLDFLDSPILTGLGAAFCFFVVYADTPSRKAKKGRGTRQRSNLSRNSKVFLFVGVLLAISFFVEIIAKLMSL